MKHATMTLIVIAVCAAAAGLAPARGRQRSPSFVNPATGTITKVDGNTVTLKLVQRAPRRTTEFEMDFRTTEKTAVLIDDKDAKVAELKAGMTAKVAFKEADTTTQPATQPATQSAPWEATRIEAKAAQK